WQHRDRRPAQHCQRGAVAAGLPTRMGWRVWQPAGRNRATQGYRPADDPAHWHIAVHQFRLVDRHPSRRRGHSDGDDRRHFRALAHLGTRFSVSAAIGFIALFGIAVMEGIILLSYFNQLIEAGTERAAAIM